jgi:ankyrin repeat protein
MYSQKNIDRIFESCRNGDFETCSIDAIEHTIGASFKSIVLLKDIMGRSLLDVSIEFGHFHIVSHYLAHGFLDRLDNKESVLELAVETGNYDIVELILCQLGCLDIDVYQPVFNLACEGGSLSIVQLLLKHHNFNVNIPLLMTCGRGHVDVVRELIDAGAAEHRDPHGHFITSSLIPVSSPREKPIEPVFDLLLASGALDASRVIREYTVYELYFIAGKP